MLFVLLLAFSLSVDALGVGITYGLRQISFSLSACILLGIMTMGMMFCFLGLGRFIACLLPHAPMEKIGACFLLCFGFFLSISGCRKPAKKDSPLMLLQKPTACDRDHSSTLDPKEAILLGLVLSTDSFGVGISIAASGLSHILLPFCAALFQTSFLCIGAFLGKGIFSRTAPKESFYSLLSGIILMLIALLRIFSV